LPRKVSDDQKKDILNSFVNGMEIKEISKNSNFSSQTIIKQLKKILGEDEFLKRKIKNKSLKQAKAIKIENTFGLTKESRSNNDFIEETFVEVVPILTEIDSTKQKDLSSEPIEKKIFPEVVYMLVDNKIELHIKLLGEYPEWSFLPDKDLERKTIKIFSEQKQAKKSCSKSLKVIKIPNPNVFKIASYSLKAKGISRIIFDNSLLAL